MGRVFAVKAPSRTNVLTNEVLTPVTYFYLDAAGNTVQRVDYAGNVANIELASRRRRRPRPRAIGEIRHARQAIESEDVEGIRVSPITTTPESVWPSERGGAGVAGDIVQPSYDTWAPDEIGKCRERPIAVR